MYLCHVRSRNLNFRVSALRLYSCVFDSWPGNTEDYKNGIHCIPAWPSVLGLYLKGSRHPVILEHCCSPLHLGMSLMWRTNFTCFGTWQSVGLKLDFFFFILVCACMSSTFCYPETNTEPFGSGKESLFEDKWRCMTDLDTVVKQDNREPRWLMWYCNLTVQRLKQ